MSENKRVGVIACGVLAIDLKRIAAELGIDIVATFLEGGLHSKPLLLRQKLQEAIDRVSSQEQCERIVIGYGLCGNGAIGITAGSVPLVIPRVHDCIALFMGSDQEYKKQFAKYPGTYYISAGWYVEKVQPQSQRLCGAFIADKTVTHEELVKNYGTENTEAIKDFVNSWQKNYQRAAFIDTKAPGDAKYEQHAKEMARIYGWKYEHIEGGSELLEKALTTTASTDDILIVPPGQVTIYDAVSGKISAAPANSKRKGSQSGQFTLGASPSDEHQQAARLGLGIDAGGTYTDAAIYDFSTKQILAKSKSLTTKWDYAIGISEALEQLPKEHLQQVDLVSVSTTLATNAIVEGHGAKVGLLVMPPYGIFDACDIEHTPLAAIRGKLDIDGRELEPVDAPQVRAVVAEMTSQGVKAFAISGYAGTVNPEHELEVKRIIKEVTSASVTCGHELSEMLNFKTRAITAVLNARIVGKIEKFLREIKHTLTKYDMNAPVVIVKGDGTLMSDKAAMEKPVETILSGPAASVAGAGFLTGLTDTIVVDMGGTTTDTASVKNGVVRVHECGTRVGGHRTHVKALDMRTVGLGGDSGINLTEQNLTAGPLRVGPICWLAAKYPGTDKAIEYLEQNIQHYDRSTLPMQILALSGHYEHINISSDEHKIVKILAQRPYSVAELAKKLELPWHTMLRTENLEEHHVITRCGLTPTDILHITGEFVRWDVSAAKRVCEIFAQLYGTNCGKFTEDVRELIIRKLAIEILKKQLDDKTDSDALDGCGVCNALLENMFDGHNDGYKVSIKLDFPVVGVGAPAVYFVPEAARRLGTNAVIPQHADVANAVGAISSNVLMRKTVRISVDSDMYITEGLPGAKRFAGIDDAHNYAVEELAKLVRQAAKRSGTSNEQVKISYHDIIGPAADGMEVYLGREITAELSGKPDLKTAAH